MIFSIFVEIPRTLMLSSNILDLKMMISDLKHANNYALARFKKI
jgi:hypothetical protein